VNKRPSIARTTAYDLPLVAIVVGLVAIGLLMVYSASGIRALDTLDDPSYFLVQQSAWAAVGSVGMVFAARMDHRRLRRAALPLIAVALAHLVVVLIPGVGTCAGGACRWLRFTSLAGVQPAEVAKIGLIVYLAFWLAARRDRVAGAAATLPFAGLVLGVAGLVVAEPDLGTAIVIGVVALALYFAAGARLIAFGLVGVLAAALTLILAIAQPYRLQRVLTFLDPWSDPQRTGYQTIQSLYGLALGGPFGEGLGAGKEKFGFLPAPYTDSIFSVLGNELGLLGTGAVILLFLAFAFRGTRIALRAPDAEGALLAIGITVWISFQAWLNMAVVASLVPMTGITLPFISYGGSSLCVGLLAVGILLSVGRAGATSVADAPRLPGASGGRGDGRPRQSAPRGRGGTARAAARRRIPLPGRSARTRG